MGRRGTRLRLAADKLTRIEETLQTLRPGASRGNVGSPHQRGTTGFFLGSDGSCRPPASVGMAKGLHSSSTPRVVLDLGLSRDASRSVDDRLHHRPPATHPLHGVIELAQVDRLGEGQRVEVEVADQSPKRPQALLLVLEDLSCVPVGCVGGPCRRPSAVRHVRGPVFQDESADVPRASPTA